MSLAIPSLPTSHAFFPMQNKFFGWIDKAHKAKHLTSGNVGKMKEAFVNRFQAALTPGSASIQAKKDFQQWVEKIKQEKHITSGNAKHISAVITRLYDKAVKKTPTPAALSTSTSSAQSASSSPSNTSLKSVLLKAKVKKNDPLYKFFFDKKFQYKDSYYDLHIEDHIGVLWLNPNNNAADKQFLQSLHAKYPKEMSTLSSKKKFAGTGDPYIDLQNSTRFANNDTYSALQEFKNDRKVLHVLKKLLEHGILNYK